MRISVLFLVSLCVLTTLAAYKYLDRKFASASSSHSSEYSIKDLSSPAIMFVVLQNIDSDPLVIKSMSFLFLDTDANRTISYNLPVQAQIDAPGRFGIEEISKLFSLAALDSEDSLEAGVTYAEKAVFRIFAYRSDKFIVIDSKLEEYFNRLFENGDSLAFLSGEFLSSMGELMYTDLSMPDFMRLVSYIGAVPKDYRIERNLSSDPSAHIDEIDKAIQEINIDSIIADEGESIAVLNGSNIPGQAGFVSRAIKNMGGRVVAVNNTDVGYEKSLIVADNPTSETTMRLSRVLGIDTVINKSDGGSQIGEGELYRADIVVILGFDSGDNL